MTASPDLNLDPSLAARIDAGTYADQQAVIARLVETAALDADDRRAISAAGADLVRAIRSSAAPGLMEVFLAEYGLSTDEGVALMCLAEALLRVPDADTIDVLIEDKIAPSDWAKHLGHSASPLVNASTWALMLTGRVLDDDAPSPARALRSAIRRLGEPVIRTAVGRAMKEMGRQFVLGETIAAAMKRAAGMEEKGYTYSYDMLGEAARTEADAARYHLSYSRAISAIAEACTSADIRANPGISVKLSALHPRYEVAQRSRVMSELVPRLRALALLAKSARMGLNVDAEEADRLALSLEVIEAVMSEPALRGWDGFGIVVQAYGPRAGAVIDELHAMATRHDRRIMVRLVKGAYWDTEIKRAQVKGVDGFPVFTAKAATDVSYIANARKLLGMTDRIYPQFATHNAHTVSAILHMAGDRPFEFQRLHGMGETLHEIVRQKHRSRCRIYAPVGAHRDLLAYLVRRLLENGANSSFVNQIVDESVPPETVAADPFEALAFPAPAIRRGPELFAPERANSRGFDLAHMPTLAEIETARETWRTHRWSAAPLLSDAAAPEAAAPVLNPADPTDQVGEVRAASAADIELALASAATWIVPAAERAAILNRAADLYEANFGQIFAVVAREAGKSLPDCVTELREAVDFLRYYAANIPAGAAPAGTFTCISPWNFPLAIFTGQVAAALATGNAVLAKPAEQTPLIAHLAVSLMHQAGVPRDVLQLLPGDGRVGAALTSDPRVSGVAFTGSTDTALKIRRAMAEHMAPGTPLIAETGGLNAMIVDSTALPEQAVQAIVESAFQSAGQRCSALRCLYVQEDIADDLLEMLGRDGYADRRRPLAALHRLRPGHRHRGAGRHRRPYRHRPRRGPAARTDRRPRHRHLCRAGADRDRRHRGSGTRDLRPGPACRPVPVGRTGRGHRRDQRHRLRPDLRPAHPHRRPGPAGHRRDPLRQHLRQPQPDRRHRRQPALRRRGPVGHRAQGRRPELPAAILRPEPRKAPGTWTRTIRAADLATPEGTPAAPTAQTLPGPTGKSNRLTLLPRPPLLCLGPGAEAAEAQARAVLDLGGQAIRAAGQLDPQDLTALAGISGVIWWGDAETGRALERALSRRSGPILPLICAAPDRARVLAERHLCIDTTAAGGNASLLSGAG